MKFEKRQKFAIRKFSVGVASVLIGQFFIGAVANAPVVRASEVIGAHAEKQKDPDAEVAQPKVEATTVDTDKNQVVPRPESDPSAEKPVVTQPSVESSISNSEKAVSTEKDPKAQPEMLSKEVAKTIHKEADRKPLVEAPLTKLEEKEEVTNPDKDQLGTTITEAEVVTKEAEKYLSSLTDSNQKVAIEEALHRSNQLLTEARTSLKSIDASNIAFETARTNLAEAIEAVWNQLKKMGHSGNLSYMLDAETTSQPAVLIPTTGSKTVYSYGAAIAPKVEFDISTDLAPYYGSNSSRYYGVKYGSTVNEDAQKLGLKIIEKSTTNPSGNSDYILALSGNVPATVEPGTYNVGFTYNNQAYTTTVTVKPVNEAPYMTLERYFGAETGRNIPDYKFKKDGSTVELKYKVGLTNIEPNEVELTPDAKRLGFVFNDGGKDNRYLTKTVTLDNTLQSGTYTIGVQSKADPYTRITANLTIEEPPLYKVVEDYYLNYYDYESETAKAKNNRMGDSVSYDEASSTAYMTSTPFGYYLHDRSPKTIADATPDSPQYTSNLWLSLPGSKDEYNLVGNNAPVTITKFEQTGGSPGVTVEFIMDKAPTADNVFVYSTVGSSDVLTGNKRVNSSVSAYYAGSSGDNVSPYRINFKTLPEKAGTYFVEFNVTDNIGRVTKHHLNLVTREVSQTTPTGDSDENGNYTLTNADVMFDADKLYRVTNPIPVAVPISDKEQNLGSLVLNKANATLTIDSKPDGVEITKDSENPTRFKIIKQNGKTLAAGVYTITSTAKDGHFGANVPARIYKFEVMDGLNPISDQSWQEGQAISTIPVSMTNGSKITSLSVEADGGHLYLSPNADNTGLTGYALKHTDAPQTAIVTATYTNNEGQSRQIKTSFTYTVTPPPVSDLTLSITNDKQTVSEGTKFADMVATATEGATVTVGTLPDGVLYDSNSKTLSGTGLYEGHYVIPVTATKDGASITKVVDLTVTPGNFNVPEASYTFTAGEAIPPITLKIPKNATVSYTGGSLPNGLNWSADNKTITGTPTQVGAFQTYAYVYRTDKSGNNQYAYANVNITVKSVPLNFSIPDNTKTVKALDELSPIQLQADGALLTITSGELPPGVNYDAATKTVSGTPTKVGTYTATFTATSPTISGNSTASATLTINVTSRDLTVTVDNKEQEKTVLTAIDNVVLTPSDSKARLEVDTSQLPPGVTYDSASRTISGTPSKVGEYLIPYKATFPEMAESPVDGGHIKINVRPLPVSINVTDKEQTIRLGETIKNMVVSHSEHSDLGARYLSVDLPETDLDSYLESTAGLNYNAATHTISGTPTKPGVYKVRLKATLDSETLGRGSAEEIITVTVVDDPVSLDIKNDRQMIALGKTSLRPITFTVPDGVTLTVDTTKLPNGVTYDESAKTISGTPTVAGAFDIPVTVTSAGGKSLTKDITIDVVDLTPATPTVTVAENNDGTHTITISQPGGQPVSTVIKNGKDGETPKVKVDRDETKKETTLTFYSDKNANNQFDEGTDTVLGTSVIKDGQDGAAGPKGEKGETGVAGPKGDQGLQGRDGQNGRDGKDILNGTSTPTAQDGKDGDTFINTTTGDVLVKKDGEWKPAGNIKGAKGDKGEAGVAGRDGKDGFTPEVSVVTNPDGSHTISITQPDGKEPIATTVKNGENGKDGRSPRIELKPIYPAQPRSARRARSVDEDRATTQPVTKPIGVHITVYYDNDNTLTYTAGDTLISEEDIYNGVDGRDGRDGIDGKSAIIETRENSDGSHTIIITNPDGSKREIVVKNGQDGKSPTIETKENADGSHTIVITNPDGTKQEIVVKNGKDGKDGKDGRDGKDGTCNCTVNPNPVQPGNTGTTPPEQPKPESGRITPPSDKPVKPESKPDPKPEINKPNTPGSGTPNTGTPETGTPDTPGAGTPNTGKPGTDKPGTGAPETGIPSTNNQTVLDSHTSDTVEIPNAVPVTSEPNTQIPDNGTSGMTNHTRVALPNTGSQTDVISILLGSGILLTLYVAKRKED
ncbi:putative Ig domain-containing protein [uncultured Streptococcus sp.]|uniref:collagen-flanked surface repeat-containing protein n=1 Tax=uncultured Streptococcus sp. TaxID=83427 RepID=UPI0032119A22